MYSGSSMQQPGVRFPQPPSLMLPGSQLTSSSGLSMPSTFATAVSQPLYSSSVALPGKYKVWILTKIAKL